MFYFVFTYLFRKRFIGEDSEALECKTRFIQVWTLFIFAINAFITYMTYMKSMWLTINGSYEQNSPFGRLVDVDDSLSAPFVHFMTGITLLALFFRQGMSRLKKEAI